MLALERHKQIMALVDNAGSVRTIELAEALKVTDETIRRDLERLELDGKLIRTHGGAVRVEKDLRELPLDEREAVQISEKLAIAKLAAQKIQAGDTLFLDASSTVLQLTKNLPAVPLTIITNALKVYTELIERPEYKVISLGGELDRQTLSFVGPLVEYALEDYRIDKYFFSCRGVDLTRGLSEASQVHARFKKRVIELSEDAYLLTDCKKFEIKSSYFFAKVSDIDCVITDSAMGEDLKAKIESSGPQVEVAN